MLLFMVLGLIWCEELRFIPIISEEQIKDYIQVEDVVKDVYTEFGVELMSVDMLFWELQQYCIFRYKIGGGNWSQTGF